MSLSAINTDSWQWCLGRLEDELPSQQFNTWIRPLLADTSSGGVTLSAPNRFIRDFVEERYAAMISQILSEAGIKGARVSVVVGANPATPSQPERGRPALPGIQPAERPTTVATVVTTAGGRHPQAARDDADAGARKRAGTAGLWGARRRR